MSKISAYPELVEASSAAYIDVAYGDMNYKMQLKNWLASMAINPRFGGSYRDDMLNGDAFHCEDGWEESGGGGSSSIASEAHHVGITRMTSGTLVDQAPIYKRVFGMYLQGAEESDMIFRLQSVTDTNHRLGFQDNPLPGDLPGNGAYFRIVNSTLSGTTKAATATSTTATTYTVSTGTWYRLRIVVSEDVSQVDFYVYDSNDTLLWHDSLTTNIPDEAHSNKEMTHSFTTRKTTAGGATALVDLDLLTILYRKELTR